MAEKWLPIPNWELLYEASSEGQIRSLDRIVQTKAGWSFTKKGRILKPSFNKARQIIYVNLNDGDRKWMCANVARLVMLAFHGEPPEGQIVLHGAAGRLCNRLDNLSYGTPKQNMLDRWRDGTMPHGEGHKNSKLNVESVRMIRKLRDEGVPCRDVGKRFGVCADVVSRIHQRKQWAWVD